MTRLRTPCEDRRSKHADQERRGAAYRAIVQPSRGKPLHHAQNPIGMMKLPKCLGRMGLEERAEENPLELPHKLRQLLPWRRRIPILAAQTRIPNS